VPPGVASPSMIATPPIPASIHDIDTTPREPSAPRSSSAPAPSPVPVQARPRPAAPSNPPPYEIVAEPSDKPKGGWWRKLTGQ
jgi:hypothetical protein